jgi:hypothetical protein
VKHVAIVVALFLLGTTVICRGSADPLSTPSVAAVQPGEREMKALAAAWPQRIGEIAQRDGDWMLRIDDSWFAWAHGRILPEDQAARWEDFAPMLFYAYPLSLPPLAALDEKAAARLRELVRERRVNPPRRSEDFLSMLLQAWRRAGIEARLVTVNCAGFPVHVHERLREPLKRVSESLIALRAVDPDVAGFLARLREITGYNYRNVEATRSRSMHSFGLAVDLIPRSYHGKNTYWLWAMNGTPDWWTIPYEKRWMIPPAVVKAFEREGFVWGGKWLFFDTMHFEYRPDILILAREKAAADSMASSPRS